MEKSFSWGRPERWGDLRKNPFMGEVWIIFGTTQYKRKEACASRQTILLQILK